MMDRLPVKDFEKELDEIRILTSIFCVAFGIFTILSMINIYFLPIDLFLLGMFIFYSISCFYWKTMNRLKIAGVIRDSKKFEWSGK